MSLLTSASCFISPEHCKWIYNGYGRYGIIVSSIKGSEEKKPFSRGKVDAGYRIARKGYHYTSNLVYYDFENPDITIINIYKSALGNICLDTIKNYSLYSKASFVVGDSKGSINYYRM